ncbi:hypothetical protein CH373_06570 [Leptospira perolatii]|uniref:Uncharacterized protein n=1 Tax=Leptospira perolatii TaxID=2023191 RepID=A0A2M9ZP22_9LEPT|nr:hypothetical protein CH360_03430 [Leptospira perolatii]PJZ73817.1 hypothetical protein CH373_06570 [Leptospira perolatii]
MSQINPDSDNYQYYFPNLKMKIMEFIRFLYYKKAPAICLYAFAVSERLIKCLDLFFKRRR